MMLRLATVGSGKIVGWFLEGLKNVSGIRHTAVYSRSFERGLEFAGEHGLGEDAVWTDLEKMADSGTVDAVYIATPNRLHAEQAEVFLRRGIHVLCEKPAVVTCEQLERLLAAAEKSGAVFMEAIMAPHQPRFVQLKQAVEEIGTLSGAVFNFSQLSSRYPALLRGELPNIFNKELCAGALMDIGVYDVYLALALFGMPERVEASAHFLPGGADGTGNAMFVYPWGSCLMSWSKTGQSRAPSEIVGDRGTVTFSPVSRILNIRLWKNDGESGLLFGEEPHSASLGNEAADFVRYILDREGTADEYAGMVQLSRDGTRLMETIREKCGIRFDGE